MASKRPTAIDLFAGCGGVSEGLRQAGFKVVGAVENSLVAANTYRLNHSSTDLLHLDIRKVNGRKWIRALGLKTGELDLLVGCPPCQGFSTLRTLNGAHWNRDKRNNLVAEMLRLIEEIRPKAVIMENVPGLREKRGFKEFAASLRRLGYVVNHGVVKAQHFGVPQRRRRLVLVAGYGFEIQFPKEARVTRTVRYAIGKLARAGRSGDPLHDMPETRSEKVAKIIAMVPKNGGSRLDLPDEMQLPCHKRIDGFKDVYGRMAWDELSPTITGGCFNPSKGRFLHPRSNRNITMREAALLQTFPLRYKFDPSAGKQQIALMIGNAVPPELVRRQAMEVMRAQIQWQKQHPRTLVGSNSKFRSEKRR